MLNTILHPSDATGTPLLIAHGLFGSGRNWGVIAKRLSDARPVVAVDMRNHGNSEWNQSHTYHDMADDLAEVIDGRWNVLGHSMGGKAAMVLALKYPSKVNKLVVADIAPVAYSHDQNRNIERMKGVNLSAVSTRADAMEQLGDIDESLKAFFMQSLDMKEKKWRLNLDALAANMPAILSFPDMTGHRFEGPVLFLSGADSYYMQPEYRPLIKSLFPNAKFAKIPGTGHWLHAEKPHEFEAAVREFLRD